MFNFVAQSRKALYPQGSSLSSNFRHIGFWLCCLALAALPFFLGSCSNDSGAQVRRSGEGAVPVSVGQAYLKDVPIGLTTIGRVEAPNTVSIKARVGGQLLQVHFKEGQVVNKGDLLFTIDPAPYEVALTEAKASLEREKALLAKAEEDLKRHQELVRTKVVSTSQYEQYFTEAQVRRAATQAAQAQVENAQLELSWCRIAAPITGPTGSILVSPGNVIKANDDKALVVIQQVQPIYIGFAVPERNLPAIKQYNSQSALTVNALIPGREGNPIAGTLFFVDNEVDTTTGTIRLKADFDNEDLSLWPGQFTQVEMVFTVKKQAVVAPNDALQTGQTGRYVYVLTPEQTVRYQPVVVGAILGQESVVETGLKGDETLITDGHFRLTPDAKVAVRSQPQDAPQG